LGTLFLLLFFPSSFPHFSDRDRSRRAMIGQFVPSSLLPFFPPPPRDLRGTGEQENPLTCLPFFFLSITFIVEPANERIQGDRYEVSAGALLLPFSSLPALLASRCQFKRKGESPLSSSFSPASAHPQDTKERMAPGGALSSPIPSSLCRKGREKLPRSRWRSSLSILLDRRLRGQSISPFPPSTSSEGRHSLRISSFFPSFPFFPLSPSEMVRC